MSLYMFWALNAHLQEDMLYTCSIWNCQSLREFMVAYRCTIWVRTHSNLTGDGNIFFFVCFFTAHGASWWAFCTFYAHMYIHTAYVWCLQHCCSKLCTYIWCWFSYMFEGTRDTQECQQHVSDITLLSWLYHLIYDNVVNSMVLLDYDAVSLGT